MDVRAQVSMVFHLDKCIGCHTCSIACKNIWTDRRGAEYMWWNNVETKPGTGYPTAWEDQGKYKGGWEKTGDGVDLRAVGKVRGAMTVFHNPNLPTIDDYYEPFTYTYQDLFDAPEGADQPVARPVSMITGRPIDVEAGPNWDDDLGGSPIYAANDPNLANVSEEERRALFEVEKLVFFYLPRICNHCVNPACVAACPSGALYKRGEDGIVLLNQERCRAWRFCVTACPYKKTYFNWGSGKSEKCILCYPRLETGQAPACFHSCVGRIRYLGMVLYDAERVPQALAAEDAGLVEAQRGILLDPNDPEVIAGARKNGIPDDVVASAQRSPVWKWVMEWKLALPLHAEHRTLPMLFYVPPLLPVMAATGESGYDTTIEGGFLGTIDRYRLPLSYMASLFGAGNEGVVRYALRKQLAVRTWRRAVTAGDQDAAAAERLLAEADCTPEQAEAIYRLTSLAPFDERFVIPPMHREQAIEMLEEPLATKGFAGVGFRKRPERGL
ncbi:MAG: nitrate reductase subunit beta [Acidobacteria bacterium]|nr:MAG: nitrate reductase subunit beta [Acidobacteriota bacterium]MCE7956799.1 nitrate reductase subunit beta [Acidobacteria bacterium ACB2]